MSSEPISILLIDDDPDVIVLIHELLSSITHLNFKPEWVNSFQKGMDALRKPRHALLLVDYKLPDGDGVELIREARLQAPDIATVLITAMGSPEVERNAFAAGAADVLDKTELTAPLLERVLNHAIERTQLNNALAELQSRQEERVLERCAQSVEEAKRLKIELNKQRRNSLRLENQLMQAVELLSLTVESTGPDVSGEHQRVAQLASAIASKLGLDQDTIDGIYLGGLVHDIGNLKLPADILSRPDQLTHTERDIMQTHPDKGYEMLRGLGGAVSVAQMVKQHHERMDGSGYPAKLKGDDILLEARILAVADMVASMTSDRPYRSASDQHAALAELRRLRGDQLDADVVDACLQVFEERY